jgi:O-antigen ligase
MLAGLVLMVFHGSRAGDRRSAARMLFALTVLVAGAYLAFTNVATIRDRFTQGDRAVAVGGLTLDTEGRSIIWPLVWHSTQQHLWLGAGPGTSTELVEQSVPPETEPHNDYLRLWHDFGLVGLALWVGGIATAIGRSIARARRQTAGSSAEAAQVAAALSLVAIACVMLTDNAIIYPFAMAPVALVMGAAADRRQAGVPATHPAPPLAITPV